MATKVVSISYHVIFTSGPVLENTTTGQQTAFVFKTIGEVKRFLSKIASTFTTSTANKFYLEKHYCTWDDETKKITSSVEQLTAEDL